MSQEEPCEDQGEKVDMLAMPGEEPGICHGVACIDPHSRTEDGGT